MTRAMLCCFCLLPSLVLAAPSAVAKLAGADVVVDGDLSEWNPGLFSITPPVFFGEGTCFTETGAVGSNDDQSATVYFALRGDTLFVAAIVRDDSVVSVRGGELWRGDGLELLFPRKNGPTLHLGVNPVGDVHVFSKQRSPRETQLRAATRPDATGWAMELSIPLEVLGVTTRDAAVPMNLAMRDVDTSEPREAHRVWSGQRHAQAASAGTLVFDRTAPPKPSWPACPASKRTVELRAPLTVSGTSLRAGEAPVQLRLVNFQSATRSWREFWTDFDLPSVKRDLDVAKRLRANAVRLFVFSDVFGEDTASPLMLERLHAVVREAAARGLLSVVTFFPFKKEFRAQWREPMRRHLEAVVTSFRGDPAIAMWDLMNEPDHAWAQSDGGVTVSDVERWAREMNDAVQRADSTHLVTVGLAGRFLEKTPSRDDEALPFLQVSSVHWYGAPSELEATFARMAQTPRPVILQEFGATSLYFTEAEASAQFEQVCTAARAQHFAGVGVWELFDHPVGSIGHQVPKWSETVENDFGLVRADGRPKAQAGVFCRCLDAPELRIAPRP